MKSWKAILGKLALGGIVVILLAVVINGFDAAVKPEVREILNVATEPNPEDDKVCAAAMGLFVTESKDFQQEGHRLLQSLQVEVGNPEAFVKASATVIPNSIELIMRPKRCETTCVFTAEEKNQYRKELEKQKIFLERFQQLLQMGSLQCRHPQVLIKFPIMAFFRIGKNQILEYELLGQTGEAEKARQGLLQLNQFVEKTLQREKYPIVTGRILVSILRQAREAYRTLEGENNLKKVDFVSIKFDEISKKTMIGDLQFGHWLLSFPLKRDFLAMSDINDSNNDDSLSAKQDLFDKIVFYFFSANETINDNFTAINLAMWDPCIGQTDIPCKVYRPNPITWIRNPIGKAMTDVLTNSLPGSYRKLKMQIDKVNKI